MKWLIVGTKNYQNSEEHLIYNRRYVLENFEKFTGLNELECVKKFFDNYYE